MSRIPETTIEQVRDRTDIVEVLSAYVSFKRRGGEMWACCPFHSEKTPSFKVNPTRQMYHCFGCGASGNVFTFLMEKDNLTFPEAVRLLADRHGIPVPEEGGANAGPDRSRKQLLYEVLDSAANWYRAALASPEAQHAREYLAARGIPPEVATDYGIGYSPRGWDATPDWARQREYGEDLLAETGLIKPGEHGRRPFTYFKGRLMLPIHDVMGRVIGFGARKLDPDDKMGKYINSPETALYRKSRVLYALHRARPAFKEAGYALVCEGQFDVIACHRAGFPTAIAPQGTAFTQEQVAILKRYTDQVVLAFDSDQAGIEAAEKSIPLLLAGGMTVRKLDLPAGEDPDAILQKEGPDSLCRRIAGAADAFEFLLKRERDKNPGTGPIPEGAVLDAMTRYVAYIPDRSHRHAHAQWLARQLHANEAELLETIRELRNRTERTRIVTGRPPLTPSGSRGRAEPGAQSQPARTPRRSASRADAIDAARSRLLELALQDHGIARGLQEELDPNAIGCDPLGTALNQVVALAQEGEWDNAADHLRADPQLCSHPRVARILMQDIPVAGEPDEDDPAAVLQARRDAARRQQEWADCVRNVKRLRHEEHCRGIDSTLRETTDPAEQEALNRQINEMLRRAHGIPPGHPA